MQVWTASSTLHQPRARRRVLESSSIHCHVSQARLCCLCWVVLCGVFHWGGERLACGPREVVHDLVCQFHSVLVPGEGGVVVQLAAGVLGQGPDRRQVSVLPTACMPTCQRLTPSRSGSDRLNRGEAMQGRTESTCEGSRQGSAEAHTVRADFQLVALVGGQPEGEDVDGDLDTGALCRILLPE